MYSLEGGQCFFSLWGASNGLGSSVPKEPQLSVALKILRNNYTLYMVYVLVIVS